MMQQGARRTESSEQELGTVVDVAADGVLVRVGAAARRARRAVSCLVDPAVDDCVLLYRAQSECYVLAVLERPGSAPVRLTAEGDLTVGLSAGRFEVTASEGVRLATPADVSITSEGLDVTSARSRLTVGTLAIFGAALESAVERIRSVAGTLESVAERVTSHAKRSYRFVEETDHMRAKNIDYAAEKLLTLHSENAVVTTEELVKIDGAQIHVG